MVTLLSEKMKMGVLLVIPYLPVRDRATATQELGAQSSPRLLVPYPSGRLMVKEGLLLFRWAGR